MTGKCLLKLAHEIVVFPKCTAIILFSPRIYDERSGSSVHVFHDARGFAHSLAFHPSGVCVGAGTSDRKVKVYDVRMRKLQQLYSSHDGPVHQVRM